MILLIKINPKDPDNKLIKLAAKILKSGGIVAMPTDTVYGIAAIPSNKKAVERLYKIKKRENKKPIALLVSSKLMAAKFAAGMPKTAAKMINKYWPGPLTIIFKKKKSVPDFLTSGLPTIGIRMPGNNIALKLIRACGGALAVTSANISGKKAATTAKEIASLKDIDLILDGGRSGIGAPSQVIFVNNDRIEILRKGPRLKG